MMLIRYDTLQVHPEKKNTGNESPGKEIKVVWAYDAKRGALRKKKANGNGSTREK